MNCDICDSTLNDRDSYYYEQYDITLCETCVHRLLTCATDDYSETELCEMMEDMTTSD